MSYLRGEYYIWADDRRVHLWAFDGADEWEDSGWASDGNERLPTHRHASGVAIPEEVLDEYIMMRFAQLIDSSTAMDAVDRALRHGNFGGEALKAHVTAIKKAILEIASNSTG